MKKVKNHIHKFRFPLWNTYFTWKEQIWLFVLVVAGTILRVINAIYAPLWRDEVYIFFTARDNSLLKLITQQHWDTAHPPLHSIFLHYWQMISIQPFWLRLPSIVVSVFALYYIPILALKLIRNKVHAFPFIALAIASFSHVLISMQMVVRPYPFVILFVILSIIHFFELIESDHIKWTLVFRFCLVNFFASQMDYGSFWLFLSYFVFFVIYAIIHRRNVRIVGNLFVPLFLSFLVIMPVLPYLFGNIDNSLKLEQYLQKKFNPSLQGIRSGKPIHVVLSTRKGLVTFFDEHLNKVVEQKVDLSKFERKVYVGLNLAPFSALSVGEFRICSVDVVKSGLAPSIRDCATHTKTNGLKEGYLRRPISKKVLRLFFADHSIFVKISPKLWEVNTLPTPITISNNNDVLITLSASELSFITNPGINIYNALEKGDTPGNWHNIQRITITPKNGFYTAFYHDQSAKGQLILEGGNIFEPFIGDIYFFSHSPEIGYATRYYLLCILFLLLVNLKTAVYIFKKQNSNFLFIIVLFWIPVVVSLIASFNGFPIFIAKNLFVVSLAALFMIGLSISEWRFIFSPLVIVFFVGITTLLYFISFPRIGFVDPPYNITSINQIFQKERKYNIAVISPNEQYFPLLQYNLLRNNTKLRLFTGSIETMQEQYKRIEKLRSRAAVYFLKFGLSRQYTTHDFDTLRKLLGCNPVLYHIPYVHLEKCF